MFRRIAPFALAGGVACSGPAWEESHRLRLDGSGESVVRVAAQWLPAAGALEGASRMEALVSGPGLRVERVRTLGDGRVEGEVAFSSFEALCQAPLFRRDCAYAPEGDGFSIRMGVPVRAGTRVMRIELRPEGRITSHNSDGPIRRGNRLGWTAGPSGPGAPDQVLRVTTDAASVFSATLGTVLRAGAIAAGTVLVGLSLLLLEGRRRLRGARRQPPRGSLRGRRP